MLRPHMRIREPRREAGRRSPGPRPLWHSFLVIGGGPAGLTAAYELTRLGRKPLVLERGSVVGGLARTESYRGFRFDMGGHRFFTKSPEVRRIWSEVLGPELLERPRLSRIYYRGRFFRYPLRAWEALLGLGPVEAVRILASYVRSQLFPHRPEESFEEWVSNRFGRRLFQIFFESYTEKVWGVSCSQLKAEWAAQRIKDLSLRALLLRLFLKPGTSIRTLIEEFHYPRLGPGMMWSAVARRVSERGGSVRLRSEVVRIHREGSRVLGVTVDGPDGQERLEANDFVSTMPLTELVRKLDPPPPDHVLAAAAALRYRDFLTVCLIVDRAELFPDNWIYVHEPRVRVARIQNFKNWSPDMVPDAERTSLGLEYFCQEGDETWSLPDAELVELAKRELEWIGLCRAGEVHDGCVFRVPKAYPVYDAEYRQHLATLRRFVDGLDNCRSVGRNGLHRYNNQDHSMLSGTYAVRNLLLGETHDLWNVQADGDYQEEQVRHASRSPEQLLRQALGTLLARLDPVALGVALAALCGGVLFAATVALLFRGGQPLGPHLGLLGEYLPGYRVTVQGGILGLAYGSGIGFLAGAAFAALYNQATRAYVRWVGRQSRMTYLRRLLDQV